MVSHVNKLNSRGTSFSICQTVVFPSTLVFVSCTIVAKMKRRLAQSFTPEAIASKVSLRKRAQDEINATCDKLKSLWNPADFNENNLTLNEDQALLLISSKLSFFGVLILKLALNHVPVTYRTTQRGTSIPIRYTLNGGLFLL